MLGQVSEYLMNGSYRFHIYTHALATAVTLNALQQQLHPESKGNMMWLLLLLLLVCTSATRGGGQWPRMLAL